MVSVHSTYNHPDHPHNHNFHVKKRRKEPRIDQKIDYPDVKNRTSWASASLARSLIREVNKHFRVIGVSKSMDLLRNLEIISEFIHKNRQGKFSKSSNLKKIKQTNILVGFQTFHFS